MGIKFLTTVFNLVSIISIYSCGTVSKEKAIKPNIIIIFTDDQGYGDLSCFGSKYVNTPRIDKMAEEGVKMTSFYVAAPVCTPSRAALMTGCYPTRVDMAVGSRNAVLLSADSKGLNPNEMTIAEMLKSAGYKTGIFGKWHLGDQPDFLPTMQGFDEFFGLPYSHDIHPFHTNTKYNFPPLPLLNGDKVIETDPDMDNMTKRITERSINFIEKNKEIPFFLYIPHPLPHRPLHVSSSFVKDIPDSINVKLEKEDNYIDYDARDKIYKNAIREIDWSVGQILDALKRNDLDNNTLVIFTSDNGPSVGSAGPLKGKKGSIYEGGMREPTVIRWPGKISPGQVNDELVTAMDLFPTFAKLADATLPTDRVIDGKNILPVLVGNGKSPHEYFFYHQGNKLQAIRSEKWKLHVDGSKPLALYNLENDISETVNVLAGNEQIIEPLLVYIKDFQEDIKLSSRPAAYVDNPKPLTKN